MKIISGFKDYYDCMLKYGQDDLVYYRHTKCYPLHLNPKLSLNEQLITGINIWDRFPWGKYFLNNELQYTRIWFCGNFYPIYKYHNVLYYSKESLWEICKDDFKYSQKLGANNLIVSQADLVKTNSPVKLYTRYYGKKSWGENVVVENPNLAQFNFAKLVPPHEAYQQIYNWLCNQAKPMKPIPEISDKIKIDNHGFNKFSFRKDKNESL